MLASQRGTFSSAGVSLHSSQPVGGLPCPSSPNHLAVAKPWELGFKMSPTSFKTQGGLCPANTCLPVFSVTLRAPSHSVS